jgi:hypothetical protein
MPAPPAFYAHPHFLPGNRFQGRVSELNAIRDWAGAAEPIMLFEAIGGMGKSMVTWEWVTNHAAQERSDWAGRFWYSFYELGADPILFLARFPHRHTFPGIGNQNRINRHGPQRLSPQRCLRGHHAAQ